MTEIVKAEFPRMVAIELPAQKLDQPFAGPVNKVIEDIHNAAWKAVVDKNGKFLIDCGFTCEKLGVGQYKIVHNIGYNNTSVNVALLKPPGTITIVEHHPLYFVIHTLEDQIPVDKEFSFTLVKAV